ncbi:GNAT family N-acetyltransferase [Maricaulis maris]|uniref:N-acetyltransferase domain-containing protein n=1 Tax=Maricaulis maris TaxID=74318 RepID=A0A495DLW7_9PROT|nr:GNAT family N-acetyltransferase [Maricaulis maris]RKR03926.1 hypothetical protein C7435_0369 [Maricaulis maris]
MAGHIRVVARDDLARLAELIDICGFPDRDRAGWDWVLFGNPAQGDAPPGWVYEEAGTILGFVGNLVSDFIGPDKTYRGAMGHTLVTDVGNRTARAGIRLARHQLTQSGPDFCYTLNNNTLSAVILPRLGYQAWLGADAREWLEWVTAPVRLAASTVRTRLKTAGLPAPDWFGRMALERPGDPVAARLQREMAADWPEDMPGLDTVGPDALARFRDRRTAAGVIVRDGSAADLGWRRSDPLRAGGQVWRVVRRDGDILALIGAVVAKMEVDGPEALDIVELAVLPGADGVRAGRDLIARVLQTARRAGLARVRLRFAASLDSAVLAGLPRPLRRRQRHDSCHIAFHNPDPALRQFWRPAAGDADFFFAQRVPPALR